MPLLTLLGTNAVGVTLGATSQIESFGSSGGITLERVIGGTSQIAAFTSTGGVTLERVIGGTSQIAAFASSGGIQVAAATAEAPTGGFWYHYELEYARRRKAKAKRKKQEEEAKRIADKLARQAELESLELDEELARQVELSMITKLAAEHKRELEDELNDKIIVAVNRAITQHNYSSMEALERLLQRQREEEEFLMQAARILLYA